ncbi:MAG TPA: ABC transporter ATP-binding protein [Acidimicrobiales bacterium]|nr:ABC transporter ATP-binding protein [Acidimicrobiales bacterium]
MTVAATPTSAATVERRTGLSVEVRDLVKRFDGHDRAAVDGVSITTEEGEYLVLLGPSGCGKTTLLRMIAGLEHQTSGDVLIGGDVVNGLPPRARRIAMVFQSYALYPHKTVRDNISFPLRAAKIDKAEQQRRIGWAAELLGIGRLLDRRPRHLSGGERQRVALARALVREPSVFLLDEPLSNLDAKLRTSARDDLREFHDRVGTTTVYVTHDQVEAMGMGDRIVVMLDGQVRQIGPPVEVYEHPADIFVATFLGSPPMNLVRRDGAIVGFRPEKMLPASVLGGRTDGHVVTHLDVHRIEHLSGDRHLHGTLTGLGEPTQVIVRLPATVLVPIDTGTTVDMVVRESDLRFFDASTEKAAPAVPLGDVHG